MMNNGVAISYGDVAPGAKEAFIPSCDNKTAFSSLSQLQSYNLVFPNIGNPCEGYLVPLDGNTEIFPASPEDYNIGLWSEQLSGLDGSFGEPVVLTLQAEGQYSSQGLTLTFDKYNGIYANSLNITWYRDGEELSSMDFTPDSAEYFCRNKVESFDKIVISFKSLNMPRNRLKLRAIDYGYGTFFYGNELRGVKLIQEIDPVSAEISINTVDFTLDSKSDMKYSFQARQPLSVYFNGELLATSFVKNSKRKAKRLWNIQSEDYIGTMDTASFAGGIYFGKNASELLSEIFKAANVPYSIEDVFVDATVTGYIPYTTCREALMQTAFAIGAAVDTSGSAVVKVFALSDEISHTIPLERIMQGQSFDDGETVTHVEITAHSYKASEEALTAYDAAQSGAGDEIFVTFSEPLHTLEITDGEILESGTNYAVINAGSSAVLTGKKYEHTTFVKKRKNTLALANDTENIMAVEGATLVSYANIDAVLDRCYEYFIKNTVVNLKIVEARHITGGDYIRYGQKKYGTFKYGQKTEKVYTSDPPVHVGDTITAATEYLGSITGRVIKQTFTLGGGSIIKETILK